MKKSGINWILSFHKAYEELQGMIGKLLDSIVFQNHEYKHNNIQGVTKIQIVDNGQTLFEK